MSTPQTAAPDQQPLMSSPAVLPVGQRRVIWGLLAGLTLLATALLWPAHESSREMAWQDSWEFCGAGGLLALATLLLAWAVLADRPLTIRGPRAVGFLLLQLWCFIWGLRHNSVPDALATFFACLTLVLLVVQGSLLGLLRWPLRWRLVLADAVSPAQVASSQFTVRQALQWTAGAAAILALAKYVPPNTDELNADGLTFVLVAPLILSAITYPTTVASLGLFLGQSRHRRWAWATAILALMTAAILLTLSFCMMRTIRVGMSPSQRLVLATIFVVFQGGFLLVLWGTLLIVRLCGYRLVRQTAPTGSPPEPTGVCPFALPRRGWRSRSSCLVLGLALMGLGLAVVAIRFEQPRREAFALRAEKQPWTDLGMEVSFDQGRITAVTFRPGQPIQEQALRKLVESQARLVQPTTYSAAVEPLPLYPSLSFANTPVTDAQLRSLQELPGFVVLYLHNTKIGDAGLAHLEGLKNLQRLDLTGTPISDAGLTSLKRLPALSRLNLSSTAITNEGLQTLCDLSALTSLNLEATTVNASGLFHLEGSPRLQDLRMPGTITDADLAQLPGLLNKLNSLDLTATQVTDAGLQTLEGLTNLRSLLLVGTRVTDAGLQHLKGLTQLEHLSLGFTHISDAGLAQLESLRSLRRLNLYGTMVSDAGLQELEHWPQLNELTLAGTQVTDAGVSLLEAHPHLLQIGIGPGVSEAAAHRLIKGPPRRTIFYQRISNGTVDILQ